MATGTAGQPRSVTILQQGPARSMGGGGGGGGQAWTKARRRKKAGGPGKMQGGPAPRAPPHATGLQQDEESLVTALY